MNKYIFQLSSTMTYDIQFSGGKYSAQHMPPNSLSDVQDSHHLYFVQNHRCMNEWIWPLSEGILPITYI